MGLGDNESSEFTAEILDYDRWMADGGYVCKDTEVTVKLIKIAESQYQPSFFQ